MFPDEFLALLAGVQKRRTDGRWLALCPAHNDQRPSLGVFVGERAICLRCFAGCPVTEVLKAMSLEYKDLFYDQLYSNGAVKPQRERRRVAASYEYQDEQGKLLYRQVRYEPKSFAFERYVEGRQNPWVPGLAEVRRVLYRLPQLLQANPRKLVLVTEGEKDVERLRSLGIIATCCPGGMGMSWRPEYSRWLAGRHVVVIPDNDPPGQELALLTVGCTLRFAASVTYLPLPGAKEKGDVSDWLDQGNGPAELQQLIQGTKPYGLVHERA